MHRINNFLLVILLTTLSLQVSAFEGGDDFVCDDVAFDAGLCTEDEYQAYLDNFGGGGDSCAQDFNAVNVSASTNSDSNVIIGDDEELYTSNNAEMCPTNITISLAPAKGSATVNNSSQLVFNPDGDFDSLPEGDTEEVTFSFEISNDESGESGQPSSATATVTVTGVAAEDECANNFVATTLAVSTNSDSSVVIGDDEALFTTNNPDNCTATITGPDTLDKGNVTVTNNQLTFDPYGDFDTLNQGTTEDVTFSYSVANDSLENNSISNGQITVTVSGMADSGDNSEEVKPFTGRSTLYAENNARHTIYEIIAGQSIEDNTHTIAISYAEGLSILTKELMVVEDKQKNLKTYDFSPGGLSFDSSEVGNTLSIPFPAMSKGTITVIKVTYKDDIKNSTGSTRYYGITLRIIENESEQEVLRMKIQIQKNMLTALIALLALILAAFYFYKKPAIQAAHKAD